MLENLIIRFYTNMWSTRCLRAAAIKAKWQTINYSEIKFFGNLIFEIKCDLIQQNESQWPKFKKKIEILVWKDDTISFQIISLSKSCLEWFYIHIYYGRLPFFFQLKTWENRKKNFFCHFLFFIYLSKSIAFKWINYLFYRLICPNTLIYEELFSQIR